MPLIECTAGPVEATVGGTNYSFQRDRYLRYVSNVYSDRHVECFLGSPLYRIVEAEPTQVETQEAFAVVVEPTPPAPKPIPDPKPVTALTPPAEPVPPVPLLVPPAHPIVPPAVAEGGEGNKETPPVPPIVAGPEGTTALTPPIPPVVAGPIAHNPAHGLLPALTLGEKTAAPSGKPTAKNRAARRRGK